MEGFEGRPALSAAFDLADLADLADLFVWETDEEDRIVRLSDFPASLRGIPGAAWIGRCLFDLVKSGGGSLRCREDMAARRSFRDVVCRLTVDDRTDRDLRLCGAPIFDQAQRFQGYRGLAIDITASVEATAQALEQHRQLVESLQQARDAAIEAGRGKTLFTAAASHDLRQPLQALGLFVATLSMKPLAAELRKIVDKIEESLAALEHLLDSLLELSRFDAGMVTACAARFPLQPLFNRLADDFGPLSESKGLPIRFVTTSAVVQSDPLLLERVLRNLISHAMRYTDRRGLLVGCRRCDRRLHIEIRDSGLGMAASPPNDMFHDVQQLDDTAREHGLGLGLAIVQRLAALLDLTVMVRSAPSSGSVFSVIFKGDFPATEDGEQDAIRF